MSTTALEFRRNEYGNYDARVTAERDILFSNGETMCTATDSVTFRLCKNRTEVGGWRLIVFANGTVICDDDDVSTLKFGKVFAARLADVPRLQEVALAILEKWDANPTSHTPRSLARAIRHEPFIAALDDFYGTEDQER